MAKSGDTGTKEARNGGTGMPQADMEFLVACLKNTKGRNIEIDNEAVAAALNYTNARSVTNRLTVMKKKYGIPFGSDKISGRGAAKATEAPGPAEVIVLRTPSNNKVTKAKNPATTRKKPTAPRKKAVSKGKKVTRKVQLSESDDEDVQVADVKKVKDESESEAEAETDVEAEMGTKVEEELENDV